MSGMPFPRKYDHELIVRMAKEGWSRREIAVAAGCAVPVVTTVLARARKAGKSIPEIPRVSRRGVPMSSVRASVSPGSQPAPLKPQPTPVSQASSYVPPVGMDGTDADRVRRDLERRGLSDLLAALGLAEEEEKAA